MHTKELSWKNFSLGSELQIAGTFLYNGLLAFDEMENFYHEDEVFECLYSLSVGLERLAKIAVILLEHEPGMDQRDYEKSLITHTHEELIRRVRKKHKLEFNANCNKLLSFLGNFYNSMRYARFGIESVGEYKKERELFVTFLTEISGMSISVDLRYATPNNTKLKDKLGKLVGKICLDLYAVIKQRSTALGIYTDEIRLYSKAYKIFLQQEFTFAKERMLQKELLIFLIHNDTGAWKRLVNTITPLEFDPAMSTDYTKAMFTMRLTGDPLDEMEQLCEDARQPKSRYERLELLDQNNWDNEMDQEVDE